MTSILLFGLLAAGANVLGGPVLVKSGAHRYGERFLKYLVALGAGFMLAAIFIEILPETVGIWTSVSPNVPASEAVGLAMALLLAGYLSIQFFEHTLAPHFHFGAETHRNHFSVPLRLTPLSVVFVFTPSSTVSRLHPLFSSTSKSEFWSLSRFCCTKCRKDSLWHRSCLPQDVRHGRL